MSKLAHNATRRFVVTSVLALAALPSVACASAWEEDAVGPTASYDQQTEPLPPVGASYDTPPARPAPSPMAMGATTEGLAPSDTAVASAPVAVDPDAAPEDDPAALGTFEQVLSPYGQWVDDPTYGTIWVPNQDVVGSDFSPYLTGGHWAYTDEGYYWNSDYAWGWAPFHYGRWAWTGGYGWGWVAGARYSPAWVDWRYGGGYMGWGPAYPSYGWRGGASYGVTMGATPYVFAPSGRFFDAHPSQVVAGPSAMPALVASTKPYVAPGRSVTGAQPFVGPDPRSAGIAESRVAAARITPPASVHAGAIAWKPTAGSRMAPAATSHASTYVAGAPRYTPAPGTRGAVSPGLRPTTRISGGAGAAPRGATGRPTYTTRPSYGTQRFGTGGYSGGHPTYSGGTTYHPPQTPPSTTYKSGGGGGRGGGGFRGGGGHGGGGRR